MWNISYISECSFNLENILNVLAYNNLSLHVLVTTIKVPSEPIKQNRN